MSISLHELLAKKTGRPSAPFGEEPLPSSQFHDHDHAEEPLNEIAQENSTFIEGAHEEEGELGGEELLGAQTDLQYMSIEDEIEMPGLSTTITEQENILEILGISQPQLPRNSVGRSEKDHDIVELFSTIAFLKKENQELQKELELVKRSKEAAMKDIQTKLETQIESLQKRNTELQDALTMRDRELSGSLEWEAEIERLREALDQANSEKETLENNASKSKDDHSSLRAELLTAKSEINKLKMELGRAKGDNERMQRENEDLKNDFKIIKTKMDQSISTNTEQVRQLQQEIKRMEDQSHFAKSDQTEKLQHINKLQDDIVALDRNLQLTNSQNIDLKQRVAIMDIMERDIEGMRHRLSFVEKENRELLTEVGSLRNQIQLSSSSMRPQPPPPPASASSVYGAYTVPSVSSSSSYGHPTSFASSHSNITSHHPNQYSTSHRHSQQQQQQQPQQQQSSYQQDSYRSAPGSTASYSDNYYSNNSHIHNTPPVSNNTSHSNPIGASSSALNRNTNKSMSSALSDRHSSSFINDSVSGTKSPTATIAMTQPAQARSQPNGGRDSMGAVLSGTSNDPGNQSSNSLASLLQSKKQAPASVAAATVRRMPGDSPFATEQTAAEIMSGFEVMERELTKLMSEKTLLTDESEKLLQRGLKTLRERTRLQQVEAQLGDISKNIASLRLKLTQKPG